MAGAANTPRRAVKTFPSKGLGTAMRSELTRQDYNALTRLNAARTTAAIFSDIAAIAALLVVAGWSGQLLVVAVTIILVARQQHALAILIHEGAHRRLYESRRLNDVVVRWLLAGPLFLSYDGYRRTHLDHHSHTMTADDPDLQFVSQFPVSTGQFGKSLLADVTGISYLALLLHYWRYGYREFPTRTRFIASLIPPVVVNAAILAGCWLLGYAWVYFVCWLAPMLLVLPALLHLRGICEHGGHEADPNPMRCTWTVLNPVETFFIAPHNINYHMEHHGFPAVPQYNLPKLHRILLANGSLPAENVHRSYRTILRKLVTVQ